MRFLTLIALVVCISYAVCDVPYGGAYVAPAKVYGKNLKYDVKSKEVNYAGKRMESRETVRGHGYRSSEESNMNSGEHGRGNVYAKGLYRRMGPKRLNKIVKVKSFVDVDVWQNKKRVIKPAPVYRTY